MSQQFERTLFEYLERIVPGEDILVEYTSNEPIHLILWEFFRYVKQKGTPVLVIDVLDHFHMFRTQLELVGMDTSLEDVYSIKVGGKVRTGNIIGEVSLTDDISVGFNKLCSLFKKVPESFVWRVTLGLDKVISYQEKRNQLEVFMGYLRRGLGDKSRVRVFTVDRDLVSERALNEVREMASRVIDVELKGGRISFTVIKSLDFEEYGERITVRATELREYLRGQS